MSFQTVAQHSSDSSSLHDAIRRAHGGDAAAFEFIYRMHRRHVYGICLRMVRDPIQAEDLVQESFALVLRKMHTFRGEAAFSTWMSRLTTKVVLMSFRQQGPRVASLEEVTAAKAEEGTEKIDNSPAACVPDFVDRISLESAIDELPAKCKAAFILHDVQGYRHREIAKILRCSVGNSKAQLHRARERLNTLLRRSIRDGQRIPTQQ